MSKLRTKLKRAISPLFAPLYAGRGTILMFHRILPPSDRPRVHNDILEVSPEKLEEIISFFRYKNYAFISMTELPHFLRKRGSRKFVVFTFDDGYVDNYTIALPIFEKHRIPFTVYVTTDWPEGKALLWHYLLEEKLLSIEHLNVSIGGLNISLQLHSQVQREHAFKQIRRALIDLPPLNLRLESEKLLGLTAAEIAKESVKHVLSWTQLRDLASNALVEIGAHTTSHPALNTLSKEEIREEIENSKVVLEKKLDLPIHHFAYPFGTAFEIGMKEVQLLSVSGFQTAATSRRGNIHTNHLKHLHALPRVFMPPTVTHLQLEDIVSGRNFFVRNTGKRIVVYD